MSLTAAATVLAVCRYLMCSSVYVNVQNETNWREMSVANTSVATPVELELQLNDTFQHYHVGVAFSVLDHSSPVHVRRPIKWAACVHQLNACMFASNAFCCFMYFFDASRSQQQS